jgi:hypothetical protein
MRARLAAAVFGPPLDSRSCSSLERLIEQFSIREFLKCTSIKVADLETAWAKKNNVPAAQVRAQFDRLMDGIVLGKRTAPSLKQTNN